MNGERRSAYTINDDEGILDRMRRLVHKKNREGVREETTLRKEILLAIEERAEREEERLSEMDQNREHGG